MSGLIDINQLMCYNYFNKNRSFMSVTSIVKYDFPVSSKIGMFLGSSENSRLLKACTTVALTALAAIATVFSLGLALPFLIKKGKEISWISRSTNLAERDKTNPYILAYKARLAEGARRAKLQEEFDNKHNGTPESRKNDQKIIDHINRNAQAPAKE